MLDDKVLQTRIVDSIFSLASNQRLNWKENTKDSYRTKAGGLQVDVDKSAMGDQVVYVLWVWEEDGTIAGRIDGRDLPNNSQSGMRNYQDVIKKIFDNARQNVKISALQRVADALDAVRESNESSEESEL